MYSFTHFVISQHCLPGQYKQVAKRDLSTVLTLSVTLSIVVIAAFAVMQSEIILEAIGKFMDDLARKLMHKHGFADPDSVGSNATVVSSQPIPPVAPYNERDGWDPEFLKEEDLF